MSLSLSASSVSKAIRKLLESNQFSFLLKNIFKYVVLLKQIIEKNNNQQQIIILNCLMWLFTIDIALVEIATQIWKKTIHGKRDDEILVGCTLRTFSTVLTPMYNNSIFIGLMMIQFYLSVLIYEWWSIIRTAVATIQRN